MVFTVCVNKNFIFSMVYRIWRLFCYVICRYISSFVVIRRLFCYGYGRYILVQLMNVVANCAKFVDGN